MTLNEPLDPGASAADRAASELAQLQTKIEAARAQLTRLLQKVVVAQNRLSAPQTALILEANEELVLATLRAKTEVDTAAQSLDALSRRAERDDLTHLPNRVLLRDRLEHAIAVAKRHGTRLALLFLDLEKFKQINDTLGHAAGDEVLRLVAQRLLASVRAADTVSRHGGDEFLILLTEVTQARDAALIAEKVLAALSAPSKVGNQNLQLTASIGISIYPDDGVDAETLIVRADVSMYRAKRQGLGHYAFHGQAPAGGPNPAAPGLGELKPAVAHNEQVLAEHKRLHALQREANERLVLAVLAAQERLAAAEQAQR